jgi:Tfp pilus assembly protein PilF
VTERAQRFQSFYQSGIAALHAGKDDEGHKLLYEAAKAAPEGWLAIAIELVKDGQLDLAEARFKEVLKLSKDNNVRCAATNNLGMIYANRGQNALAFGLFEEASKLSPEIADSFSNKGLVRMWSGDWPAALRYVNHALRLDPWHEQASFIRAMTLLQSGDYAQGFKEYECRWRSKSNGLSKIAADRPEWNGSNGKRVFIYGEQGHGDSILMLRYARLIKERGIEQVWVAQKSMGPLLKTIPYIDEVVEVGDELPEFDCHLPAVSLPRLFGTTIETIPPAPYLAKHTAIHKGADFQVGIVWKGSKAQGNDTFRSTTLAQWSKVLSVKGARFFSLQVDGAEDADLYPELEQFPKTNEWLETAQRISALDLIISVDTSIVHLAGAMGIPCLCALHCRPYFVFPQRFEHTTPWYASVRLYRQKNELDWEPVFDRIAKDLEEICH